MRNSLVVAVMAALAVSAPHAQQVFRSAANLVEVDVVVRDRSGSLVRDLRREDFSVTEDGKPVAIDTFSFNDLPLRAVEAAAEPSTTSGLLLADNAYDTDGRILLIVLDDFQVRFDGTRYTRARRIAGRIVDEMQPGDLAAVIATSGVPRTEFTNDKARLLAAVGQFMPSGEGDRSRVAPNPREPESSSDEGFVEGMKVETGYNRIADIVTTLRSIQHRRKSLFLISEGSQFAIEDVLSGQGDTAAAAASALDSLRAMIRAAQRANTSVYAFDAGEIVIGDRTSQLRKDNLRTIAEATSGFAVVNTNAIEAGVHRAMAESGTYYLLGYLSPAQEDGKHHSIRVRVARDGVDISAREGYFAARDRPRTAPADSTSPIAKLLVAPLQKSGLPMRLVALPVPSGPRSTTTPVAMVVHVPAAAMQSARGFQLSAVAIDVGTAKIAARDGLEIAPGTVQGSASGYVRMALRLDVKPGKYQIRLAGRTTDGSGEGSVFAELNVAKPSSRADISMLYLGTEGARVLRSERIDGLLRVIPVATEDVSGSQMRAALLVHFTNVPVKLARCAAEIVLASGSQNDIPQDQITIASAGSAQQIMIKLPELTAGSYRLITHVYAGERELGTRELTFRRP